MLLYVNQQQGRAGIIGSYQGPGPLGGGSNNVQLVAGHRIWLVSSAYAKALKAVVPSGSLTGGAVGGQQGARDQARSVREQDEGRWQPSRRFFEAAVKVGSPPRSVKIQGWFKETSDGTKIITSHAPAYEKSWPKVAPKDY